MDEHKEKRQLTAWFVSRPWLSGFIVFLILESMVLFVVFQRYRIIRENDRREMSNLLHVVYENIDQTLKNSSAAALTLALTIHDQGAPADFDTISQQIIDSNPGIDAVQLVPAGVIKYVYPLRGNESVINYDILNNPATRKEALKSLTNKKMYFAGPLPLKQGGMGVVGRLPVFLNNKFWGFSGVVIRLETLLKTSGIHSIDESKYYFQFSHVSPQTGREEFYLPVKEDFSDKYFDYITFPDTDWTLYIITKNSDTAFFQIVPITILGSLFSILFGLFIFQLLRKPAELQLQVLRQTRKLLNSEIKYRAIFEKAAVGIAHIDTKTGKFIDVNDQYLKMLGYTREELKEIDVHSITVPEDIEAGKEKITSLRNGEIEDFSLEKRYYNKSGDIVWANVTVSPLWKPGEKPTAQIAVAEDITLKKKIRERMRQSEERFQSLFENSPTALWEEDFSGVKKCLAQHEDLNAANAESWLNAHPEVVRQCISLVKIININNECVRLHRPKTRAELIANHLPALIDENSAASFIKQLAAIVKGSKFTSTDTQILNTTRGDRDIHLRWSVMKGYEETLERVIISTEDITALKESERIIRNSQQHIESLINTIDGIVWECDYNTFEFTFVNKKAEEIMGYPVSDWLYDAGFWIDKMHPEDREWAPAFCQQNSETKAQYYFEYRMIASDGSVIWLRDIVNVVHEKGVPVSLKGIMIDITKAKEAEKDLNDSLALVNEQKKRLMNFSYIVSHNLRSHTANIQSIITFIETAESDEERDEMIHMLKTVSGSLNDTMIHLNDLVNIQANVALTIEPIHLRQYVENTKHVISELIESKKAEILNNISDDVVVNYNPAYLESILLNLFSNALRYSHPDRTPVITADWVTEGGNKILKVSDNGIGIDLERYGDKLFGMYKTFNGNADARGIGLFMTKNQIEAMGGSISVESEPGKGTTFLVRFR